MDREYCLYDTWSSKFVKACFIAWHMINIFVICVLENNLGSLITEWNFFTVDNFNESRKYIILSFFVLTNWFYTHKNYTFYHNLINTHLYFFLVFHVSLTFVIISYLSTMLPLT